MVLVQYQPILPYELALTLPSRFTIKTYLQRCNTPVSETPLFRAQPRKELPRSSMLLNIVLASLNLYLVAFVIVIARAFVVALEVSQHSISPSRHV